MCCCFLGSMLHHHLQLGVLIALQDAHGVKAVGFVAQIQGETVGLRGAEILHQLAGSVVDGEAGDRLVVALYAE